MNIVIAGSSNGAWNGEYSVLRALSKLNHVAFIFDHRIWSPVQLSDACRKHDADLLLVLKGAAPDGTYIDGSIPQRIKKEMKIPTVMWQPDDPYRETLGMRLGGDYDFLFSNAAESVVRYREAGLNAHLLNFAYDPAIHFKMPETKKEIEISFVGQAYNAFTPDVFDREVHLNYINEMLPGKLFMTQEFIKRKRLVFNASKINWNANGSNHINVRVWEIMGCGGFLLNNNNPAMFDTFKEKKHFVSFSSPQDMVEKIIYYLEHDEEREKIALAGYNLVSKHHSYVDRMKEMLKVVGL